MCSRDVWNSNASGISVDYKYVFQAHCAQACAYLCQSRGHHELAIPGLSARFGFQKIRFSIRTAYGCQRPSDLDLLSYLIVTGAHKPSTQFPDRVSFLALNMMPSNAFQAPTQMKGAIMGLEFTIDTDHRKVSSASRLVNSRR
jgi:hypothetical protein